MTTGQVFAAWPTSADVQSRHWSVIGSRLTGSWSAGGAWRVVVRFRKNMLSSSRPRGGAFPTCGLRARPRWTKDLDAPFASRIGTAMGIPAGIDIELRATAT
jgi:hypothetical protein